MYTQTSEFCDKWSNKLYICSNRYYSWKSNGFWLGIQTKYIDENVINNKW